MSKIIIRTEGVSDNEALWYVSQVVSMGKVSSEASQYCFATIFHNEVSVYATVSKCGTNIFRVVKPTEGGSGG